MQSISNVELLPLPNNILNNHIDIGDNTHYSKTMSDSNMKWYLATSRDGKDGKIITNDEMLALSPGERVGHLYTLSSALREGLISADLSEHTDINALTFWHAEDKNELGQDVSKGPKKFLTNQLRDKIMAAKIAAAQVDFNKKKNT